MNSIESFFNQGMGVKPPRDLFSLGIKESWKQRAFAPNQYVTFGYSETDKASLALGTMAVERRESGLVVLSFTADEVVFRGFRFAYDERPEEVLDLPDFDHFEMHETAGTHTFYTRSNNDLIQTEFSDEQIEKASSLFIVEAHLSWNDRVELEPDAITITD